jgi:hypothetical protein
MQRRRVLQRRQTSVLVWRLAVLPRQHCSQSDHHGHAVRDGPELKAEPTHNVGSIRGQAEDLQ